MTTPLRLSHFQIDRGEAQLEPNDETRAEYVITNTSEDFVLTNVELTHLDRHDVDGRVTLRCTPRVVRLDERLGPHQQRTVALSLQTLDHLPGVHGLRVQGRYECEPVVPVTEAVFEVTVAPD